MDKNDLRMFIGYLDLTIVDAMKKIDKNSAGLLYVVGKDERLVGCISDGDIRRWIIKNGDLNVPISRVMNDSPVFVRQIDKEKAKDIMKTEKINSLAVTDEEDKIADIIFAQEYLNNLIFKNSSSLADTPIIIMAGGKGTRLYPYTKILPKPLIPIGEIPIIERIMDRFNDYGANRFYITVNYKKEMIKSYFSENSKSYRLIYVDEDKPLGTAGSIGLIEDEFDSPVIVTNCDILIEENYGTILEFHKESGNLLTVVSSLKKTRIPYGVIRINNDARIVSMEEKPEFSNLINTGMYVVNPEVLQSIPSGIEYDMTDLIKDIISTGGRVGVFPIGEDSFLDMGELEELRRMEDILVND